MVVAGGAVEITSTNLTQLYKDVKLPAELSGKNFTLRVKKVGTTSVNGGTVALTGASNINHIVIKGTTTEDGGETTETCAEVVASVESGKVAAGTEITLSCQTEGQKFTTK